MKKFQRIVTDPNVMGGKPCIRGMRITVGNILNLLASSLSKEEILKEYPYLELEDIDDSLKYAAWRISEYEVDISAA
ncbi:MAG: DUF433 domain-containing protein [Leptospira sp.]|nr:DUF433 domain-containing protein [Leptospira sp.]